MTYYLYDEDEGNYVFKKNEDGQVMMIEGMCVSQSDCNVWMDWEDYNDIIPEIWSDGYVRFGKTTRRHRWSVEK